MNAIILTAVLLALGGQDVQTDSQSKTQLYVKTTPTGATVTVDGKSVGKSDGLFDWTPGSHNVTVTLEGHAKVERTIEAKEGEITRIEIEMKKPSDGDNVLGYVGDSSNDKQSYADSGHAVQFNLPPGMKSISAVKLYGSRYGYPQAPKEDFHLYILDQDKKVLEHIAIPYGKAKRTEEMQWHAFEFPAVQVPEKFYVAFWFNAQATKGVYVGKDKNVKESHSYVGLPDKGYQPVGEKFDWMIRAVMGPEDGKQPSRPKVTTYEDEKAADTESEEALPTARTWNDASGEFSLEAQFIGVEDGKVKLKKSNGKTISIPLDKLSQEDKDFVAQQNGSKTNGSTPAARESVELKHDDGKMAGKSSIAGGGHGVRFEVDNEKSYVTSVSLHGSRYGEARPPKDTFSVWICDENFKAIARFQFPYSSFIRGEPSWKTLRIRPTKVPKKFIVCFGFNPHQTKGVYVSYDAVASETSLVGVPGGGREAEPFAKGNWLIRCKVEKR